MTKLKVFGYLSVLVLVGGVERMEGKPSATFNLNGNISNVSTVIFNVNFHEGSGREVEVSVVDNSTGKVLMTFREKDQQQVICNSTTDDSTGIGRFRGTGTVNGFKEVAGSTTTSSGVSGDIGGMDPSGSSIERNVVNGSLTEDEEMQLNAGVSLDFSLNETRTARDNPEKLISAPGCPLSVESLGFIRHPVNRDTWVYFGNPTRCFLVGSRGPCPEGMKIGRVPHSPWGVCKCSCYLEVDRDTWNSAWRRYETVLDPYLDLRQEFCYDGTDHYAYCGDKCYQLLTQGPCNVNEVFVFDETRKQVGCKVRECPEVSIDMSRERLKDSYGFVYNGSCHKLNDPCEDSPRGTGQRLVNTKYNPNPTCLETGVTPLAFGNSIVNEMMCSDANQRFSGTLNRCVPFEGSSLRENRVG